MAVLVYVLTESVHRFCFPINFACNKAGLDLRFMSGRVLKNDHGGILRDDITDDQAAFGDLSDSFYFWEKNKDR